MRDDDAPGQRKRQSDPTPPFIERRGGTRHGIPQALCRVGVPDCQHDGRRIRRRRAGRDDHAGLPPFAKRRVQQRSDRGGKSGAIAIDDKRSIGPLDFELHDGTCAILAHRRLSIVDLAGGHQPLSNEDGSIWVTFHGEIYNHADVRRELELLFKMVVRDYAPGKFPSMTGRFTEWTARRHHFLTPYALTWLLYVLLSSHSNW